MDTPEPFLINHRFLIDLSRHTFYNLETQAVTRLELRHVNLLGELYRNRGQLVERDFLIRAIWQDYSGADEALTQGISVLRKLLADEQKELIKTIPKKGYIFLGEVSAQPPLSLLRGELSGKLVSRVWLYWTVSGVLLLAVLLLLLRGGGPPKNVEPRKKSENKPFQYIPAPADSAVDKRIETKTSLPLDGKYDRKKTSDYTSTLFQLVKASFI
jgi:DNA-binding winged helix-turn-helix (wHTH) protein